MVDRSPDQNQSMERYPGVAIVHVQGDHFMLYDAENGLFYDPAEMEGPGVASDRVPTSYLTVYPSALSG